MAEAEIGALRIRLGFDVAEFAKGVKQAEELLTGFAAKAREYGAIISGALAAGVAAIGAAFTINGIKNATRALNDLGRTADAIGVTTTQLQELGHVAFQAGISHSDFNDTLKTFKDRLEAAHAGAGALVDNLRESDLAFLTNLRSSTSVADALNLVADKYITLTDATSRGALATAAFGSNTDELARLLSGGSAGIKKMRDEAEGLGVVVSATNVKTGTEFAEAIRKLTVAVDESSEAFSVSLKNALVLVTPLLYVLVEAVTVTIIALQGISREINKAFSTTAEQRITSLTSKAAVAAGELADAQDKLSAHGSGMGNFLENNVKLKQNQLNLIRDELQVAQDELRRTTSGPMGPVAPPAPALPELQDKPDPEAEAASRAAQLETQRQINAELERYNQLRREGKKVVDENATTEEQLAQRQAELNRLLQQGAIDSETYGRAMQKATLVAVSAYAGMASMIAGNLEKVFSNSKAVAIASALINTFEAATKAYAAYPPPWNFAAAASVVAAGLAQVANIRSTSKSGGGGGSSGGGSAPSNAGGGQGSIPQLLTVQGINEGDRYSGGQMRDLANAIIRYQKDGGQVLIK